MDNIYIEKYEFLKCSHSMTFLPLKVVKDLKTPHFNVVMKYFSFKIQNSPHMIFGPKVDSRRPIMFSILVCVPVLKPNRQEVTR